MTEQQAHRARRRTQVSTGTASPVSQVAISRFIAHSAAVLPLRHGFRVEIADAKAFSLLSRRSSAGATKIETLLCWLSRST